MSDVINLPPKDEGTNPPVCETMHFVAMRELFGICQKVSVFGCVVGVSGSGKTTASKTYAEANHGAFYYRVNPASADLQPGLYGLVKTLGVHMLANASKSELWDALLHQLGHYERPLVLIDEAQLCSDDLLECLRNLYDHCETGMVLIGDHALTDRWSPRGNKRRYNNFAQLRGRIGPMLNLPGVPSADVAALCQHHGITGKRACDLVARYADFPGGLHNVHSLLQFARGLAGPEAKIELARLREAADQIMGELK